MYTGSNPKLWKGLLDKGMVVTNGKDFLICEEEKYVFMSSIHPFFSLVEYIKKSCYILRHFAAL